jgi:hypothetical protein
VSRPLLGSLPLQRRPHLRVFVVPRNGRANITTRWLNHEP